MRRILHLALHDTQLFILAKENFFFMFLMPVHVHAVLQRGARGEAALETC